VSVSNWATSEEDIERSAAAILKVWKGFGVSGLRGSEAAGSPVTA
jgi:hypothetical protein